jgi:pilus assembly protein CpaF
MKRMTLIRAFNSGHDGSISTVHSSNAEFALFALEMLFQMNLPGRRSMPPEIVRQYIGRSINLVVYAGRRDINVDGVIKVVRKIEQICLIKGVKMVARN